MEPLPLPPLAATASYALRPYQRDAVERVDALARSGARRLLLVLPTGGGKTVIAAHVIRAAVARGQRVLFIAHRRELIHQAYRRLVDVGVPEEQVGVLMASDRRRRPVAPVQVASIDTLRHRPKPPAEVVFVDECHRVLARSYRDVAAHYARALHLGLTATPFRADGKGLGDAYDEMVVVATPRALMDAGFLVEPRVFTLPRSKLPDLAGVRVRGGDYSERELEAAVDRQSLVGNIVEHWSAHAAGVRTIAFAVSIAHSRHIAERFRDAGVPAEHLDGTMPATERDAILARLATGETLVVSNCSVLGEGFDEPSVKCAILARPTKSTGLYLQQVGRVLRPYRGQGALVLDHAGCVVEHGLPQDERAYSLEPTPRRGATTKSGEAPVRVCESCFAVMPLGTRRCESCGAELSRPELPAEAEGQLVEVSPEELRRLEWERLERIAAEKGYKPGWAYHRFRERFGEAPPAPRRPKRRPSAAVDRVLREAVHSGRAVSWSELSTDL